MIIDLCKPLSLPVEFVTRLRKIEHSCMDEYCFESLIKQCNVYTLIRDINHYCESNRIIGIHYTRAMLESIYSKGLLVRDGATIRKAFLSEHGYLFSQEEILKIEDRWKRYFCHNQNSNRDNFIFFNFTETALGGSGTEHLLGMYGGEQVSMCFDLDEPLGIKLGKIGVPMVVRCSLDPNQVTHHIEYPWGKVLVSSFHKEINSKASRLDFDGYQSLPVKPEDILELRVLE